MQIDIVPLPSMLRPEHLSRRCVVVFDVLRATTCMAAALHAGAVEIRAFRDVQETLDAAAAFDGPKLLGGERDGVVIDGFDFGNSPGDMTPERVVGKTLFMTTTNGTQAIAAARKAPARYVGAFVNLYATAFAVHHAGRDVTLLCSGTNGEPAPEDEAAAEALRDLLRSWPRDEWPAPPTRDAPASPDPALVSRLRDTRGGHNVIALGQEADIDFAATPDRCGVVARVLAGDRVRPVSFTEVGLSAIR